MGLRKMVLLLLILTAVAFSVHVRVIKGDPIPLSQTSEDILVKCRTGAYECGLITPLSTEEEEEQVIRPCVEFFNRGCVEVPYTIVDEDGNPVFRDAITGEANQSVVACGGMVSLGCDVFNGVEIPLDEYLEREREYAESQLNANGEVYIGDLDQLAEIGDTDSGSMGEEEESTYENYADAAEEVVEDPTLYKDYLPTSEESKDELLSQVEEKLSEKDVEDIYTFLKTLGEDISNTVKSIYPPIKRAILTPNDYIEYITKISEDSGKEIIDEETLQKLARGDVNISYLSEKFDYTPTKEEVLHSDEMKDTHIRGAREQTIRRAVAQESVEKTKAFLEDLEATGEGYTHDVSTHWEEFTFGLDLIQMGAAAAISKVHAINAVGEYVASKRAETLETMGFSPDDALQKGAEFALKAHQGYVEARGTALGYPPQRFLYSCQKGDYDKYKCERDEDTDTYRMKINGKEVVVSHFVRMVDKDGNTYWVGTDDPEAVDEEALNHATIILKEVNGWFWKSDNVKVLDPKTGEEISEEDLPGIFG